MADKLDIVLAEYQRAIDDRKLLVEIRFKLLVFVPTVTTIAVGLAKDYPGARVGVALVGFITTFAVVMYEIRNTQLHDAATHSVNAIGLALGFDRGVFPYRPAGKDRPRLFGIPVKHDLALALIYGVSMAVWTGFVIVSITQFATRSYAWAADLASRDPIADHAEWFRWLAVGTSMLVGVLVGRAIVTENDKYVRALRQLPIGPDDLATAIDKVGGGHAEVHVKSSSRLWPAGAWGWRRGSTGSCSQGRR